MQKPKNQESAFRLRELQLKNARSPTYVNEQFDITRHVRLVPPFNEQHIACYINGFEKTMNKNDWPKDRWVALLESVLTNTAQGV